MSDLRALRDLVRGDTLLPGDPGFEEASLAWNLAVPQRPAAVVRVADAEDVATLVRAAAEVGAVLAVQPGGHGATAAMDGTVLVRTGVLDQIEVDPSAGTARIGSGVKWGQLNGALRGTGLIGLAGSNPDVSTTGYLLGGGLSWFGRRYGIASSHLRAVDLVDASGQLRRVDDESDPELMWALRGGGGEFGIVTAVEVDLPREPMLFGGSLVYPMSHAQAVVRAFRDVSGAADENLTHWVSLMHVPDVPIVPEEVRGKSLVTVMLTWLGPEESGRESLAELRAVAPVLMESIGPLGIENLGSVADEPTDPVPFIDWATTLSSLEDATMDGILDVFVDPERTALVSVELRHLGGAFGRSVPQRPGACDRLPGQFNVTAMGIPLSADMVDPINAALRDFPDAIPAEVNLDRVTPTFLSVDSPLTRAFDEGTLERLTGVKDRVDPNGLFRSNVPLTGSTASRAHR